MRTRKSSSKDELYYIDLNMKEVTPVVLVPSRKYEEICAPRVEDFCFITDSTYTKEEVLNMEGQVLKHMGFQLSAPTAKSFLRYFLFVMSCTSNAVHI